MKKDIIFWLDGPPICCKGLFDAVAKKWCGKAYYVCTRKIDESRLKIIEESGTEGAQNGAEYIMLDSVPERDKFCEEFLFNHKNDIHIFNGYMSSSSRYIDKLFSVNKEANVAIWAERPCLNILRGNSLKIAVYRILHTANHYRYALKYRNKVKALFPLGNKGIEAYKKLGWSEKKMYSLLYLPVMEENIERAERRSSNTIRFVYLGRFSRGWKGTDILIDACKKLKNDNYTLEMVGGYGDYKEQTLDYISSNPHLSFGGTWPISEACQRLHDYDVCIVPSRMEGWNVTVNEAIMAGIGCIVTDEAVSDEMITASGAGIVTKATSESIAEAMERLMENPALVDQFKNAAYEYRNKTNADICAKYFIELIDCVFGGRVNFNIPTPPWQQRITKDI